MDSYWLHYLCSVRVLYLCVVFLFCFFFFKQKTAYEMRISDWSSDVCSSDLLHRRLSGGVRDYLILCCAVDAGEWGRDVGRSWIGSPVTFDGRLGDAPLQPDIADR